MQKKKIMKVISIVSAVAIVISGISGCKKSDTAKKTGEMSTLLWYVPAATQSDVGDVVESANKIIEPKIGAKLDLQFIDIGAYNERMNMNMASGSKFDLCFTGYVNQYTKAAEKGGLLQLDKYLENTPKLKKSIPDYAWNGAKIDGKTYAVPNMQILAIEKAIVIDKKLAEKYNLDTSKITKLEDMEPFLEQIKNNEKDYYPYNPNWGVSAFDICDKNSTIFEKYIYGAEDESGKWSFKSAIEVPRYVDCIKKNRSWYEKGYIRKDIATVMEESDSSKKTAVSIGVYKPGMEAESAAKNKGNEIIAIPYGGANMSSTCGRTAMTGIGRGSSNPELAVKLLELVNTDKELFNTICFGVEKKHYKKISDNRIEYINPDNSNYYLNMAWVFGNQFNAYLIPGQEDDVWEKTIHFNESAEKGNTYGFEFDNSAVKNEIAQVESVFSTYKAMDNGSDDPANYLNTFIKKAKDAGIDKICEELKRQMDEFKKNK